MNQPTFPPQPPFPDLTITQMIIDRIDLHTSIDALLAEFHRHNAGLDLKPVLRNSWDELRLDICARFSRSAGTCDMADARVAIGQLQDDILTLLRPFARKYHQARLDLTFDYVQCVCQSTVSLHF